MNQEMFGTLPDGTVYTKRRNLWNKPIDAAKLVTYKGYECEKWSCKIGTYIFSSIDALPIVGPVGRETHFTVSFDYILVRRQVGTTNVMNESYNDGYIYSKWFGAIKLSGSALLLSNQDDWSHLKYTFCFNVDKGQATRVEFYPALLRDQDSDLYIRNIMITYGDEDYPYTPAPEIDETVVLTEGAG